jgi:hypothetical protein
VVLNTYTTLREGREEGRGREREEGGAEWGEGGVRERHVPLLDASAQIYFIFTHTHTHTYT